MRAELEGLRQEVRATGEGACSGSRWWWPSELNCSTTPGDQSPFFPRHNLSINGVGDHQHGLGAQNGSPVLPYVYLTPFRKG